MFYYHQYNTMYSNLWSNEQILTSKVYYSNSVQIFFRYCKKIVKHFEEASGVKNKFNIFFCQV